jgi:hypothetical protein
MKICGFILAFYLILLSVVPCCVFDSCPDDKMTLRAGTEQSSDQETSDEDCSSCSPFFSCQDCATATVDFQPANLDIASLQDSPVYTSYLQTSLPKVDYDFWQPPKLS